MRLTQDLPLREWKYILDPEAMASKVYVFQANSRTAVHPVCTGTADTDSHAPFIAWPIVWLLSSFHRKHLFAGRDLPSLSSISKALEEAGRKVQLRWRFFQRGARERSL